MQFPAPRIIYSPHYNISFFGLERMHPFDSRKYARAWRQLRRQFGRETKRVTIKPAAPVSSDELLRVHSREYLAKLRDPAYVARALELPPLRRLPAWVIEWRVLRPMRWATAGTVLAAHEAVRRGLAVNLSGGYHHAAPDRGEGFCIYSDIALAVDSLRRSNAIAGDDRILYIDCDAHQGNGVCHCFFCDKQFFIFDAFNSAIYPADAKARRRIDCPIPLPDLCSGSHYLATIESKLPPFIDQIGKLGNIGLAIYNAGSDIYRNDYLGQMNVSADEVLRRDQFVLTQLMDRRIPTLMLPSGGYSRESYQLIANTVGWLLSRIP